MSNPARNETPDPLVECADLVHDLLLIGLEIRSIGADDQKLEVQIHQSKTITVTVTCSERAAPIIHGSEQRVKNLIQQAVAYMLQDPEVQVVIRTYPSTDNIREIVRIA